MNLPSPRLRQYCRALDARTGSRCETLAFASGRCRRHGGIVELPPIPEGWTPDAARREQGANPDELQRMIDAWEARRERLRQWLRDLGVTDDRVATEIMDAPKLTPRQLEEIQAAGQSRVREFAIYRLGLLMRRRESDYLLTRFYKRQRERKPPQETCAHPAAAPDGAGRRGGEAGP